MISTTPWASSVRRSTTSAAAPRPSASEMNRWPSILPPRSAKNTPPCCTSRESAWKVPKVFPTWVPPISPPPVASRSSRRVNFIRLSVELEALVGRYAPVDDQLLGDLLPDWRGGQVAVVERPVVIAAGIVRLAHPPEHPGLWCLGGQAGHEGWPTAQA